MQKTILIVEDEFLIALDLQQMLERRGWRVLGPAATVQAALRLLEQDVPNVALLDVQLRSELVTRVAETLAARGVPFAVASAFERPERFGGAILTGVPNVGKPTQERRLLATLERLTEP
ncbi:response regulator [Roseococcus sp. SYP-B2431]|uniref:response regulator n=1 Tax=Roseococcus sp. SYP-B2431 TaxID=2496640 RepID=UPI00103DA005|nr:response regulator [Roseococcus sp. SYP-B2431]TCH98249.1 response regulator [Roseococcus sp. SYP-B2431]